jgi:hypothetical protein
MRFAFSLKLFAKVAASPPIQKAAINLKIFLRIPTHPLQYHLFKSYPTPSIRSSYFPFKAEQFLHYF